MSSRRNGSSSRAAELASKNRLHMDRNQPHARITDPSLPAGRRKEIDNVMKRARAASPGAWDRKLLQVEEKDPNRWRHTGYKQMYLDGSLTPSPTRRSRSIGRRSRSPVRRSRSPVRRSRSPVRRSRSPVRRSRSPVRRSRSLRRSPVRRSPVRRVISPPPNHRRASPLRTRSPVARGRRTPPAVSSARRSSPQLGSSRQDRREVGVSRRESPGRVGSSRTARLRPEARPVAQSMRPARPPSPPPQRKPVAPQRSPSCSSSCSNDSCSVCTPKPARARPPPPPAKPLNSGNAAAQPSSLSMRPTKELLKAREANKRTREEKVLEWQRSQMAVARRIKREGERRSPTRAVSPGAIAAALNDDDDESSASSEPPPAKMTLSERFGKMAQWSLDRSATIENMRITRRDAGLHVRIEGGAVPEEGLVDGDVTPPPERYSHEPAPVGSYPEELLAAAPGDMPSWDDVRVRYDYYKKRGYLRGLTLSDYVKWEEWWYKYQEWLKRERAYERWASGEDRREGRKRRGRRARRGS